MSKPDLRNLVREAAITVVFTYVLLVGGTLNGLSLYEAINVSLGLLALIGIVWLGWAWWRRQPIAFSPVALAWGFFLAAYALTGVFSVDPRRSLNSVCLMVVYALVWALVSDLIRKGWPAECFTRVIVVVGTMVIGLAIWQSVRYQLDWLAIRGNRELIPPLIVRPHPFLSHGSMVAFFINMLWPTVLVTLLGATSRPRRVVAALWVLLAWGVLLFASSRASWIGVAVALPITVGLWWLTARRERRPGALFTHRRLSTGWLIAGAGVVLLVGGLIAAWIARRALHGAGLASRLHFWKAAWQAFVTHPILGLGPGTFATAYAQYASVPPTTIYLHAHNQVMQLLAESGLLGILGGVMLLLAIGWAGWRHWRATTAPTRRFLAGVIGGLTTAAVQCFFDTPTEMPVNMMLVAVVLAFLTTRVEPVPLRRSAAWWRLTLTLLVVGLLAVGVWSQFAYRPYVDGVILAELGDWQAAASRLEQAVARDPGHALYNLTSGYVHGILAERGDADALPVAIRRYEAAVEREPGYGLNYANLAALYWQQGNATAALVAAEQAVKAAPLEATFWLGLGHYREGTGDLEGAREAYHQALTLRPGWSDAYYWRSNEFRRSVLTAWRAAHSWQPQNVAEEAQVALDAARYEEAVGLFDEALALNSRWVIGYALRAEALMNLGRYQEATYDARIAAFLGGVDVGVDPTASVYAGWVLAQIAYRQGDLDTALLWGERALDAYRRQSIFGPGTWGHTIQEWSVAFHRVGINADLLPQLVTIRFPDPQVAWLETVGSWYEEAGDLEAARRLYREALEAAPDAAFAAERLAVIENQ